MKDDYVACYRILGLQPGCTWAELRTEYRKLVRQWHPDHYGLEPKAKDLAEEKIKEINTAFENLSRYRDAFGSLPTASSRPPRVAIDSSSETRATQPDSFPIENQDSPYADWPFAQPTPAKPRRFRFLKLVLIGVIAWLMYAVWKSPSPTAQSAQEEPAQQSLPASIDSETTAPVTASAPATSQQTFSVGSTRQQVLAAQGYPSKTTNSVWYYGESKVYFADGAVVRWENDPRNPLKIARDISGSSLQLNTFSIGSTKAQVREIQGRPLVETDREWDYGASKIYFAGDQVSGWYSSPFEPLKTSPQQAPQ